MPPANHVEERTNASDHYEAVPQAPSTYQALRCVSRRLLPKATHLDQGIFGVARTCLDPAADFFRPQQCDTEQDDMFSVAFRVTNA
jgi:hypothetical protein